MRERPRMGSALPGIRLRHLSTSSLHSFRPADLQGTIMAGALRTAVVRGLSPCSGGQSHDVAGQRRQTDGTHRRSHLRGSSRSPQPSAICSYSPRHLHRHARTAGAHLLRPADDVVDYVSVAAGALARRLAAMLFAVGGYSRDIFGAGTEEYKLVVKASLLSAGLVGIGCYLTGFPLSRGFFLLVFTIGTPLLIGSAPRAPPLDPAHPPSRSPARGRDHCGRPAARRRRRRRPAPRVLARLHRAGCAHHARHPTSWRPRPASRSSATPPTPPPRSRAWAPRSSSSPRARSAAPRTCVARCGSSRTSRSRPSSSRA